MFCIFISPEEGAINPANIFANVDLPQPDSPTIPSDSFAFKLILILFTALKFIDCLLNKPLFLEKNTYWVRNSLDIDLMKEQLQSFKGKKDFSSFKSSNCNSKNPIKTVKDINLTTFNDFIIITIIANAFLQNMVRIMVGTLIDIAKNENNMSIQDILDMKDRKIAGKTAPACGLFFLGPKYPDELQLNTCEENIFDRYKI